MSAVIKEMTVNDISTVTKHEEMVFGHSLGENFLLKEITSNPFAYYYILEKDNEIIGYIGLWITVPTGQIVNFYVLPEYQGFGYGKKVLGFAIDKCDKIGVKTLSLEVRVSNDRAQNLYSKYGFKKALIRNSYYSDKEDAILLVRNILR